MKKSYSTLLALLLFSSTFAQKNIAEQPVLQNKIKTTVKPSQPSAVQITYSSSEKGVKRGSGLDEHHNCKSHDFTRDYYQRMGIWEQVQSDYLQNAGNVQIPSSMRVPGANTFPIIFHVVYNPNNPAENVSNALIMQVYNDLVEDFTLLNADASQARSGFGFVPADPNINFCLATSTPTGTPLTEVGVVRVSTTEDWYNSDGGEENKMKSSATGGSQIWDRNKYLNVWICDISNGANSGTAGYAYRPTTSFLPGSSIDGIVLDYNLGMNNDNVLTHEVGHYLGLDHTWGGSGSCSNDDGFTDTPNTAGPSFNYSGSCSGNQSTCSGVQTQYENYMDYSNCTVMFTQNQADYMLSILNGIRSSLLQSPGCDPVDAPPVANFTADIGSPIIIPVGGSVNFTDISTNSPTAWTWNFGGGAANQTVQNPAVTFNTVGTYTVTLTASNSFGSDSEIKTGFVQVVAAASGTACDTLRNYNPVTEDLAAYITEFTGWNDWGYFPGTGGYDYPPVFPTTRWADRYVAPATTQVRRLIFPILQVDNNSGTGLMKIRVHSETAGNPGAVLVTDTLLLADMDEQAYNTFDFTNPPTVTGAFWISFELFYGTPQDTVVLSCVDFDYRNGTLATGVNTMKLFNNAQWRTPESLYGTSWKSSLWLDVLTSNGPAPVANFTYTEAEICQGGQITVNGSGSTNTTFYDWYVTNDPVTTVLTNSNLSGTTFTFANTGNHRIYLFADGSCKTSGLYLPVVVNALPAATLTGTATTCGNNNGIITITNPTGGDTPNYSYSINGSIYQTGTTFSNLAAGTYTVYIKTPGSNCQVTYSVTIGSSTAFTATVSPNTSVCPGNSATITASGGTTYAWYDGATLIGSTASLTVTPATTTQYTCLVTNGSGCQSTVYATVAVTTPPSANFTFSDFCFGAPNGPTNIATAGGTFSFSTAPGDGATISATTGVISNPTLGATYSVQYAVSGTCPNSFIETVTVNSVDDPSFIAANWCQGNSNTVTNIATTGGTFSLNPTPTDGATISSTSGVISNAVAGNSYTIEYLTPTGACQSSSTQTVTYNATPAVNGGNDQTVCGGATVTLSATGATTYSWTGGVTNGVAFTPSATTTYTVTGTSNGCTNTDQVVVTVNPAPTVNAGTDQSSCEGSTVTLTATGSATTYTWDNGITQGTSFTPAVGSTTYTVTGTGPGGCTSTDQVSVTINSNPTVTLASFPAPCVNWEGFLLSEGSPAGGLYSGTGVSSNAFDPSTAGVGTYTITYDYTDGNGCSGSAQGSITVDACASIEEQTNPEFGLYPNPTNELVNIEFEGKFQYTVFDASGRLITFGSGNNVSTVDMTHFESGVYMFELQSSTVSSTIRVIKQ